MGPERPERAARRDAVGGNWAEFREPVRDRIAFPDAPFARLGLTHIAAAAGDTLVAIALAKTLFFVSPNEARGKVLLYLLLTLAPFAVVSPFIGPLIDRYSAHRKHVIVASLGIRSVVCLFLVRDHSNLGLFPETFALLVLSKGYAVGRNAVIPSVVTRSSELVRANSKLSILAGLAGFIISIPGGLLSLAGPGWVAFLAAVVFSVSALCASTLVLSAEPFIGESRRASSARAVPKPTIGTRSRLTTLRLAALVMAAQRALIGMLTFLVAFTLKRDGAPTWWLGLSVGAGVVGGLLGSGLAPILRRRLGEMSLLMAGLGVCGAVCTGAAVWGSRTSSLLVALTVSLSASVGRLAYDSLLQRFADEQERGALFARSETRFQLAWVVGALLPVVFAMSRHVGFSLMALFSALMIAVQMGGERSLARIDGTVAAGRGRWHRPAKPTDEDWLADD